MEFRWYGLKIKFFIKKLIKLTKTELLTEYCFQNIIVWFRHKAFINGHEDETLGIMGILPKLSQIIQNDEYGVNYKQNMGKRFNKIYGQECFLIFFLLSKIDNIIMAISFWVVPYPHEGTFSKAILSIIVFHTNAKKQNNLKLHRVLITTSSFFKLLKPCVL